MAIYHLSAKVISRAAGRSAVAAAAYRSASRLPDERLGRDHDFTNKAGVVHSEVLLPDGTPEQFADRSTLWNAVEAAEVRKDAQLAREVEFAIPREMNPAQGIDLARDFVAREFVDRGMIADLNVHWDIGADGQAKPHAHVMLTMREVNADGFGAKVRDWNATALLQHWREAWAAHVNERCAELGIDARIDHRSYEEQGIALEPQNKLGPAAARMLEQGQSGERAAEHLEIARRNGERIIADPAVGLDAITHQQSTFTVRDLARTAHRHSEGKEQFDNVLAAMRGSDQLVALGKDGRGEDRLTTRSMLETELSMARLADRLDRRGHDVTGARVDHAAQQSADRGLVLSVEQRDALRHVTRGRDLSLVIGYAGSGKSAMLGAAREAWEEAGYNVRGAALSGIAAENLENGSGIRSRTIASLEYHWQRDRERLNPNDVLVIDEAGMVGSRQMERVLREAEQAGAKVVLVGDTAQLQAIEAGAAFRLLSERHGAAEIGEVRRQREGWQREATRQLATGRTAEALRAYEQHGMIRAHGTREDARTNLIERWDADRRDDPARSRLILTHTHDEVRELNDLARDAMKRGGMLAGESAVKTARGTRLFATGDRLIFLRNERDLGVRNGTLATIERASPARIDARLDDGRRVAFDTKSYADIDHGYAATIHKAQGVTVDGAHVLATPGMDRHAAYVALSRHRDSVELHYGRDDFADMRQLARVLGRERGKDTTLDYDGVRERLATDRGYDRSAVLEALDSNRFVDERHIRSEPAPDRFASLRAHLAREAGAGRQARPRSPFEGLRLNTGPIEPARDTDGLSGAVRRYAAAHEEVARMKAQGLPTLEYQREGLARAAEALDRAASGAAADLANAFARDSTLAADAANGRTQAAIRAMRLEAEVRASPQLRAARFTESWKQLKAEHGRLRGWENEEARARVFGRMKTLAGGLGKDPAMAKAFAKQWSLEWRPGSRDGGIGQALMDGLGRGRGLSR